MTAPTTTSPSTTEPPRLRALQIETQTEPPQSGPAPGHATVQLWASIETVNRCAHPGDFRFPTPGIAWLWRSQTVARSGQGLREAVTRRESRGAASNTTISLMPEYRIISRRKTTIAFDQRFVANHSVIT
jgi:hypothetical protein